LQHPPLLGEDVDFEFLVDRDRGLAPHLGVEVPQIGRALAVMEQTVEGQGAGTGEPQAAADEDQGHQPAGRVRPSIEVGG